jgi:para-nitrobenzyl esterase
MEQKRDARSVTFRALLSVAAALASGVAVFAAEPVATTTSGRVRGYVEAGITVFKGIPYGGDTALRRFQAPVAPEPWTNVRDATRYGPEPPQALGTFPLAREGGPRESEDCLTLNIWTPGLRDGRKRPVLVWLHGGGYDVRSGNRENGRALSQRGDVVVVTVNHRLNGFGYLYLAELGGPEFADSGNAGMLDLVLALRWVRDNIAGFGGDPGCVTLFGHSGGAGKCAVLMAMPAARGLFHRVWSMSGFDVYGRPVALAAADARTVLKRVGLTPARIGEIKTIPWTKLQKAVRDQHWQPVVDGGALPRSPFSPSGPPFSAEIPMVLGTTRDEARNIVGHDERLDALTWDSLPDSLQHLRDSAHDITPSGIAFAYRQFYPGASPTDVFQSAMTAGNIWRYVMIEAERHVLQGGPTYVYCVTWPGEFKAGHGVDVPLVFNQANLTSSAKQKQGAQEMADRMSEALIAFARTGDPGTPALPWPRYDLTKRPTLIFDRPPRVENDPQGEERKFWLSPLAR